MLIFQSNSLYVLKHKVKIIHTSYNLRHYSTVVPPTRRVEDLLYNFRQAPRYDWAPLCRSNAAWRLVLWGLARGENFQFFTFGKVNLCVVLYLGNSFFIPKRHFMQSKFLCFLFTFI